MAIVQQYEGLRGWLILVGLIIIATPFQLGGFMVMTYDELFSGGLWHELTSPDSESYHPIWKLLIIAQYVVAGFSIVAWLGVVILFFRKKQLFPRGFIAMAFFTLGWSCVELLILKTIYPEEPLLNSEDSLNLLDTLLTCAIFVPYMIVSKRVKATFVR